MREFTVQFTHGKKQLRKLAGKKPAGHPGYEVVRKYIPLEADVASRVLPHTIKKFDADSLVNANPVLLLAPGSLTARMNFVATVASVEFYHRLDPYHVQAFCGATHLLLPTNPHKVRAQNGDAPLALDVDINVPAAHHVPHPIYSWEYRYAEKYTATVMDRILKHGDDKTVLRRCQRRCHSALCIRLRAVAQ